ncbi:MAG: hypothetical protein IKD31_03005 [Clostridia bacterium]|nr:hypothetical protein [Clostridia bacterium]
MNRIRIGWAQRDVSTEKPVNMSGQFYMRPSKGILDPLTVTALVLENGEDLAVFVSGDMIDCRNRILDDLRDEACRRCPGIAPEKIILHATHTHTAATHVGGIGSISFSGEDTLPHDGIEIASSDEYRDFLVSQMVEAVAEAYESRSEGGISYGYGFAVVSFNRRVVYFDDLSLREGTVRDSTHGVDGHVRMYGKTNDPGFSHYETGGNPFCNLMFTFDGQNQLTGAIVNVPCPSQNSEHEKMISADYWHDVRTAIREKYGDIFILPQCAAAGDLSPRQLHYLAARERRYRLKYGDVETRAERKTEIFNRKEIAERILACFDDVYAWAKKEIETHPRLSHRVQSVQLPKRLVTKEDYEFAKKGLEKELESRFSFDGTPEENLKFNSTVLSKRGRYRRIIARYESQGESRFLPMEMHVVQVGDIAFATNRFELFMDYEQRIQARSPFVQTFVVQLAAQPGIDNGSYLPTERGLWGRGFGASVFDNQVTPEAGQIIVDETVKTLTELMAETEK